MAELDDDADRFLALAVDDALRRGEAVMLSSTLIYRGSSPSAAATWRRPRTTCGAPAS